MLTSFVAQSYSQYCGIGPLCPNPSSQGYGKSSCPDRSWVEKLGELDAGKIKLPIYLIFNSSNRYSSPYSGLLEIPLLASRMEQIDENTFLLRSPSGWLVPFVRNSKVKTILDGSSGMKAELDESRKKITVWSECGDKIMFSRGHITQLQIKDVKLDYIYSGDQVSEIRDESGKAVLKANFDPQTKEVGGISLGSNSPIMFHWGEMPTGVQQILTKVVLPDGSEKSFEFGTDAQMRPTLKVNGKQEITWDPTTLLVHKVDDWTYKVAPGKERFANAAIGRTNSKGQTEFWHYDGAKGVEIIVDAQQNRTEKNWFVSGSVVGALRSRKQFDKNSTLVQETKCIYDEKGKLLREHIQFPDGMLREQQYFPDGSMVQTDQAKSFKRTQVFNKGGDIVASKFVNTD